MKNRKITIPEQNLDFIKKEFMLADKLRKEEVMCRAWMHVSIAWFFIIMSAIILASVLAAGV